MEKDPCNHRVFCDLYIITDITLVTELHIKYRPFVLKLLGRTVNMSTQPICVCV